MLEHCLRYKRISIKKDSFNKGQKRAAFFQCGARAPLVHPLSYTTGYYSLLIERQVSFKIEHYQHYPPGWEEFPLNEDPNTVEEKMNAT